MPRWTESGKGTAWWSDRHSPTTAQTLATVHSSPHYRQHDHSGQQTCDQTPTIHAPPAIENPADTAISVSVLCKQFVDLMSVHDIFRHNDKVASTATKNYTTTAIQHIV